MRRSALGRGGTLNWKPHEVTLLLDTLDSVLPLGEQQWASAVAELNSLLDPSRARTLEACRLKFKTLRSMKKPTGDPTIPPVRQ
jgi:hypothetical protein